MEYKKTTRVDLPEEDFSFHKDNPEIKEMTAFDFSDAHLHFLWPFYMLKDLVEWRLFMKDAWLRGITSETSLSFGLSSWKQKSTSGKSTLVVFLYILRPKNMFQTID